MGVISKVKAFNESTIVDTADGRRLSLFGLFIPLLVENVLMNLMGTVNTLMLGHYADDAVAACGAAGQVVGFVYTFYAVVSGGASVVISHRLGEGDEKKASDAVFTSFFFEGGISLVCGLTLMLLAGPLMRVMQLSGQTLTMAMTYFRIVIGFSFLQGIMSVISAALRSYGMAKKTFIINIFMNIANVALNYLVLYGPVPAELVGVKGIAIANTVARVMALALGIYFLCTSNLHLNFKEKNIKTLKNIGRILRIGIPSGASSVSYSLSQVVSTSILAVLGTTALTAKIYVSSIVFYVYVVGYSLGLATAVLIGWMKGAGKIEEAFKINQRILRFAVTLNVVLSCVIALCHVPLMRLFTSNEEIIGMTATIFLIDIAVEFGRAFNHVENNSLNGAGDVLFPMIISVISAWGVSILFSYILGIKLGLGLTGCWIAFAMDEIFRGLIFFFRFRTKKWIRAVV